MRSAAVEAAFRVVDRRLFAPQGAEDVAYHDRPIREGRVHLSAPHMYAAVVETLELKPGQSFLNLGSGSGYLSHIVAALITPVSVPDGGQGTLNVARGRGMRLYTDWPRRVS